MAATYLQPATSAPPRTSSTRDLLTMALYLRRKDAPHAAERLEDLDRVITKGSPVEQSAWDEHLYDRIHTDGIIEGVRLRWTTPWWFGALELVRNFWVLLPLVLTWYGIWKAVEAYFNFLSLPGNEEKYKDTSFVFLWQGGFGGELAKVLGVKLGDLALLDCVLLAILVALTLAVVAISNLLNAGREKETEDLRDELTSLLFESSRQLAQGIGSQNVAVNLQLVVQEMKQVREQFDAVVQRWGQDQQAMQDMRAALSTAASEMRVAATSLQQSGQYFTQTNAELRRLCEQMVTSAGNLAGGVAALAVTVNALKLEQEQLTTEARTLVAGQQSLLGMEQNLVAEQHNAVAAQSALKDEVVQAVNGMAAGLATISGNMGLLGTLAQDMTQLVGQFDALSKAQIGYVETLKQMSNAQGQMVTDLSRLAPPTAQAISNLEYIMNNVWTAAERTVTHMAAVPTRVHNSMGSVLQEYQAAAQELRVAAQSLANGRRP